MCCNESENDLETIFLKQKMYRVFQWGHTAAENVNVHIVQKREIMTGWMGSCSSTVRKMCFAARTVAKNEGAY